MGSLRFQAGAPLVSEPMLPYAQTASTEISLCLRPRWRRSPRVGGGSDQEAPHRPQGNATLPQGRAVPRRGGWDPGVNVSKKTASLNPTQSHYDSFEYFLDRPDHFLDKRSGAAICALCDSSRVCSAAWAGS